MFLPLPLEQERIVTRKRKPRQSTRLEISYSGKFVSVKDYVYVRVAKQIGEQQVGINLFYLVDSSTIVGYRNSVGYYLRQGAKKRDSKKQTRKAQKSTHVQQV